MKKKLLLSFFVIVLVVPLVTSAAGFSDHWFQWLKKDQSAQVVNVSAKVNASTTYKKGDKSADILEAQTILASQGLYKGDQSGLMGPKTVASVAAYQKLHGLTVTGTLDTTTLDSLRGGGGGVFETRLCNSQTIPRVKVLSPNGGETYEAGEQVIINWETCNLPYNASTLVAVMDDRIPDWQTLSLFGSSPALEFATLVSSAGNRYVYQYSFTVPSTFNDSLPPQYQNIYGGEHYKILANVALDFGTPNQQIFEDSSDNLFSIEGDEGGDGGVTSECNARVLYPHPGQTYTLAENATPSGNFIGVYGFVLVTSDEADCDWNTAGSLVPTNDPNSSLGGLISVVESGGQFSAPLHITGNYNFANPTIGDRLYSRSITFDPQTQPAGEYHLQFTDADNQHPIIIPINIEY